MIRSQKLSQNSGKEKRANNQQIENNMNIIHKIKDLSTGLVHESFQSNTIEGKEIALNKLTSFGVKTWLDENTCKVTLFKNIISSKKVVSEPYTKTFQFIK